MARVKNPRSDSPTIDKEQAAAYRERLDALDYDGEGRVHMLVATPEPHRHVTRKAVDVIPGRGLAADHDRKSFYKGAFVPGREVSAITKEVLDVLDIDPSVVGDNLITEGLDLAALEEGDRLRVGDTVVLERSDQPHRPCTVFRDRTSPEAFAAVSRDQHRGTLFVVRRPGTMHVGDPIRQEAKERAQPDAQS
jgi:hypothetical protein